MVSLESLDGLTFRSMANTAAGEVDSSTKFHYSEENGEIWAHYSGGSIKRGYLVGTRDGDILNFRYAHLNVSGETATGHCVSTVSVDRSGLVVLNETWEWESRPGQGTSTLIQTR